MATTQAVFQPDVWARCSAEIRVLAPPEGMSFPPPVIRYPRETQ